MTYFERQATNPTRKTLERISETFGVPVSDLIDEADTKGGRKPGPASRLEQLAGELAKLPRSKQRVVVQMLEGFLQKEGV